LARNVKEPLIVKKVNFKSRVSRFSVILASLLVISAPSQSLSLSTGAQNWLRADLEALSRSKIIKAPISTWPVFWPAIEADLKNTEVSEVAPKLRASFTRLKLEATRSLQKKNAANLEIRLASKTTPLTQFEQNASIGDTLSLSLEKQFGKFEAHLQLNAEDDDRYATMDGSFIGYRSSKSFIGVGKINHFWGNGHVQSLALGNTAPPRNGLFWRSASAAPFELPILRLLGPYSLSAFAEILDDERHIGDAKLIGFSASFRPLSWVELSGRRLMQWGGAGRSETADNFLDLLIGGRDNCSTPDCKSDEPGNQIGALEVSFDIPQMNTSVFIQYIGEDEANYFPSRGAFQYGLKHDIEIKQNLWSFFVEYSDTVAGRRNGDLMFNTLYNHGIYKSGYRFHQISLGAPTDNDSRRFSFGGSSVLRSGDRIRFLVDSGDLNYESLDGDLSAHSLAPNGAAYRGVEASLEKNYGKFDLKFEFSYRNAVDGDIFGLDEGGGFSLTFQKSF
jgi:hypothetical protein